MEAATPLRPPVVRTVGDRIAVDRLLIDDPAAVRLVRTREQAGEDTVKPIEDAIEVGARVLEREQTGADAELVRAELQKASREVDDAFAERARALSEQLERQLDQVFGPDSGHLARALERHFSDGSSEAVQNRVRDTVRDLMAQAREDLLRQFSSADGRNPLADFKTASIGAIRQMGDRQDVHLRGLLEKMAALEKELQGLRDERSKRVELAEERERGTAKGRSYEEAVWEALDVIALAQGDDCDAVGTTKGATRRTGDVVVSIDGCNGPARGRIVFEAKDARLSKPEAVRQLDRARLERDAQYAVLVVPSEEELPARTRQLREVNGDKLFVVYDPEEGSALALEVAYTLARARVLAARGAGDGLDATALGESVERAVARMEDVRAVKQQLTGATTSIERAREILDAMAETVRGHLEEIHRVLDSAQAED
ncbi:MAG TPA: hypothetical protein VKA96_07385 [Solirubrobacteraceae bacterium]|nr:hypothetical protein [Solirubrobacteraceae bacterium]